MKTIVTLVILGILLLVLSSRNHPNKLGDLPDTWSTDLNEKDIQQYKKGASFASFVYIATWVVGIVAVLVVLFVKK
jgi:hypothetical protein